MSHADDDPRCPECGGPIGQRATYCMHCSADLTSELEATDADEDGAWDQESPASTVSPGRSTPGRASSPSGEVAGAADHGGDSGRRRYSRADDSRAEHLLDPGGLVDNTLTVVVGIAGGLVVGLVGTFVLLAVTGSGWALLFGLVAWLGATAHLVRRRTVQGAVARSGYAVAVVLLSVPVIALSPVVSVEGGVGARGGLFVFLLVFVAIPAVMAAGIGWTASRYAPEDRRTRTR